LAKNTLAKPHKVAAATVLVLGAMALQGCGGSGDGTGNTPTPPPAPTPTPTPTPSGNNTSLIGLTQSENFTNDAAYGSVNFPQNGGSETVSVKPATLTVAYDASSKGYTITDGGRSQTWLPANIDKANSNAGATVYNKTSGSITDTLTLTNPGTSGHFTYQYVGSGYWQQTNQTTSNISGSLDAFTYGVVTPDSALPRSGAATYSIDILAEVTHLNGIAATAGSGTLGVDFQSGNILATGTMPAVIMTGQTDSFTIAAKLSGSTNNFSGNITWDDFGKFTGAINGRFYGPAGQEVGAAFSATQTGVSTIAAGTIIGRGTAPAPIDTTQSNPSAGTFFYTDTAGFTTTGPSAGDGFSTTGGFSNGKVSNGRQEFYSSGYFQLAGATLPSTPPSLIPFNEGGSLQEQSFGWGSGLLSVIPNMSYVSAGESYQLGSNATFSIFGSDTPASAMPRTGSATFDIVASAQIADPAYPNTVFAQGTGTMSTNLASGAIIGSGTLAYHENYEQVPPAPQPAYPPSGGAFTLTGTNSSTTNGFSGTFSFDSVGTYSGQMNGRYYGPAMQEVGAVFSATTSNGGVAAGEFIGIQDYASPTLLEINKVTQFPIVSEATQPIDNGAWVPETTDTLTYDPTSKTYTFVYLASNTAAFGPAQRDTTNSDATFSIYNVNDQRQTTKVWLFNPGPTNPTLALSYTSFIAVQASLPNGGSTPPSDVGYYVPFGTVTAYAALPKSGTASYNGIVYGSASTASNTQYNLSGTSALAVDFGAATVSTTLNMTATPTAGGASTSFGTVTMNGTLGSDAAGNSAFKGTVNDGTNTGSMQGQLNGPAADEFGLGFTNQTQAGTHMQGVAVGKKN